MLLALFHSSYSIPALLASFFPDHVDAVDAVELVAVCREPFPLRRVPLARRNPIQIRLLRWKLAGEGHLEELSTRTEKGPREHVKGSLGWLYAAARGHPL